MKIRYEKKEITKNVKDISIGTVFSGRIVYQGVYVKTHDEVVDLENPTQTWTLTRDEPFGVLGRLRSFIIFDYVELNARLIVNEKAQT